MPGLCLMRVAKRWEGYRMTLDKKRRDVFDHLLYELAGDAPAYDIQSYVDNTVRPIHALLREFGVKYEDLLPGPRQTKLDAYEEARECRA